MISVREKFFNNITKFVQDKFLLLSIVPHKASRVRVSEETRKRKRDVVPELFFAIIGGDRIKVWQKKFQTAIKHIGKTRLSGITNRYFSSGQLPRETRGGDRVKDKNYEKKLEVRRFICTIARESHYGRNKSVRLYLPSELCSINKQSLGDVQRECGSRMTG